MISGVNINFNMGNVARAIKKPGEDDIFTKAFKYNGSVMRLLKPYIIQPTFFVSKNVKREFGNMEHDVITEQVDIFATFIAQALRILVGVQGKKETVAIELLSTGGYDYNLTKVAGKALKKGMNLALDKAIASLESKDFFSLDDATMKFRNNSFLTCSSEYFPPIPVHHHNTGVNHAMNAAEMNNAMMLQHQQMMTFLNGTRINGKDIAKACMTSMKELFGNVIPKMIEIAFREDDPVYLLTKVTSEGLSKEIMKGSNFTLNTLVGDKKGMDNFLQIDALLEGLEFLKNPDMNLLEDTEILQASDIKIYEDAVKKMEGLKNTIRSVKISNDSFGVVKELKKDDVTTDKDDILLGEVYLDKANEFIGYMNKNKSSLKKVLRDSEVKSIENYLTTLKDCLVKWNDFVNKNFKVGNGSEMNISSESYNVSMELVTDGDLNLKRNIRSIYENEIIDREEQANLERGKYQQVDANRFDTKKLTSKSTEVSGVRDLKDQEKDAIYGYQIRHFVVRINVEQTTTTPEYDPYMMNSKNGKANIVDKPNYTHTNTVSSARTIEIPVTVKANIFYVEPEELINAITYKGKESSFTRRWEEYRSGGIGFWDLVFAGDLVRSYRQNKLKDTNKVMEKIASSNIHSLQKIMDHGVQGFDRFYNMYCFTADDAKKLEFYAKSKLSNYSARQKIMEALNAQQIMILDKEWETAKLYLESMSDSSTIPFKKIGKRGGKDKVNDILEALMANQAPRF